MIYEFYDRNKAGVLINYLSSKGFTDVKLLHYAVYLGSPNKEKMLIFGTTNGSHIEITIDNNDVISISMGNKREHLDKTELKNYLISIIRNQKLNTIL